MKKFLAAAGLASGLAVSAEAFAPQSVGSLRLNSVKAVSQPAAVPTLRVRGGMAAAAAPFKLSMTAAAITKSAFPDSAESTKRLTPATACA